MAVTITHTTPADGTFSAAGAAAWDATHAVSGLGTMAEQNANNVNITGGTISGVTLSTTLTANVTGTSGFLSGQVLSSDGSKLQALTLGTMATQNANSVSITGGTISGVTGLAASGANSDITSLSGLTTPLSVAQGGSGTATPSLVAGTNISVSGTWPNQTINSTANVTAGVGYTINGNGNTIVTGVAGVGLRVPFACTIDRVTLLADQTGSIVIDIWKDSYANYPPTVADSICASAKPTITTAIKSEDTTLTGWTKTIAAGDILYFNVDSCTSIQNVVLTLRVTKT